MLEISPCKRICNLNHDKSHCLSCLRTIEEIRHWSVYSYEKKKKIMNELTERS